MTVQRKKDCPCKRSGCERYGDCAACVAYHRSNSKFPVACQRGKQIKPASQQTNAGA